MDFINSIALKIDIFILILTRISGVIVISPVFGSRNIPMQAKIGLSATLAIIIFNVKKMPIYQFPDNLLPFILTIVNEFIIGLVIGFAAQLIFAGIQLAGEIIDMQMGFGIVNVIDPVFGTQVPLIGNFKYLVALMIYLATNSHYILINALFQSYDIIPIFGFKYHGSLTDTVLNLFIGMFVIALQICIPIVGAIFVVQVALGILARTVPQMNVFIVGMPINILIGFIIIILILPFYSMFLEVIFNQNLGDIMTLLKLMR